MGKGSAERIGSNREAYRENYIGRERGVWECPECGTAFSGWSTDEVECSCGNQDLNFEEF